MTIVEFPKKKPSLKFPKSKRHRRSVSGNEIWDQQEPPKEMVWEVCPYLRMHRMAKDEHHCKHCPPTADVPNYGKGIPGCYGLAAEACRIVFAMQARQKKDG